MFLDLTVKKNLNFPKMGRVVLTHSTYINGLIPWCRKLAKLDSIQTITPGVIGRTKGLSTKFTVRITREIYSGYKLIARKGTNYQEIYLVTKLNYEDVKELIEDSNL